MTEIAHDLILYGRIYSSTVIAIAAILLLVAVACFGAALSARFADHEVVPFVIACVSALGSMAILVQNLGTFILVWAAPNAWAMQAYIGLVKP